MSNKKWSLTKAIFGKSSLPNYTEKSESDDSSTEDEEKLETDDDEEDFITLDKSKFRPKKKEKRSLSQEGKQKIIVSDDNRPRSISAGSGYLRSVIQTSAPEKFAELPQARTRPQFGISPIELVEMFPDEKVPSIIIDCVEILQKDLSKEGIFRIPGRLTKILEMKIAYEQGNPLFTEGGEADTHAVASLLAQFFRELPEPLLTYSLYSKFIDVVSPEKENDLKLELQKLTELLPPANFYILSYFIEFLTQVAKYSGANRMAPRNLALVFGASLLNPPPSDQYDLQKLKLQCTVVEHLIENYYYIFQGDFSPSLEIKVHHKDVATIPAGMPTQLLSAKKKKTLLRKKKLVIPQNSVGTKAVRSASLGLPLTGGKDEISSSSGSKLAPSTSFHSFEEDSLIDELDHDLNKMKSPKKERRWKEKKKFKKDKKKEKKEEDEKIEMKEESTNVY